jgi:hypothetical protein
MRVRAAASVVLGVLGLLGPVASASATAVWTVVPTPPMSLVSMRAVSCPSLNFCIAVGQASDTPLIESWDGTSWSSVPSPALPDGSLFGGLEDVSCPTTNACMAVGDITMTGGADASIIEHWDGSHWTLQTVTDPAAAELLGVSCSSETACTAVGQTGASGVVERYDGTGWSTQPTPDPSVFSTAPHPVDTLHAVSCTTATHCVAAGSWNDGQGNANNGMVEAWDGTSWTVQFDPPVGSIVGFTTLSCSSSTSCVAAGASRASKGEIFSSYAVWNGADWTAADADGDWLGVACASSGVCVAVGAHHCCQTGDIPASLLESWDGMDWTSEPPPAMDPATSSAATAVSCPQVDWCVAIGKQGNDPLAMVRSTATAPPGTTTGSGSGITSSGATLNGTVNPEGGPVSGCRLEWGTSASYGNITPCGALPGSGSSDAAVSAALSGLAPSTTYHFRVEATNGVGTTFGNDQTFTTEAASAPPAGGSKPPPPSGIEPPPPSGPVDRSRTMGYQSIGPRSSAFSANVKRVNRYRLAHAERLSSLVVYLEPTARHGSQWLQGIVYSDAHGKPNRLLATTRKLLFRATDRPNWFQLTFKPGLKLKAGHYWLGILAGGHSRVAGFRYRPVRRARALNADTFAGGPSTEFGPITRDGQQMSLYASY